MEQETLMALCETYRGLTVEQVAEAIGASRFAPQVADPMLLAQYIVSCCEAYS